MSSHKEEDWISGSDFKFKTPIRGRVALAAGNVRSPINTRRRTTLALGHHRGPLLASSDEDSPPTQTITAKSFYKKVTKTTRPSKKMEATITKQISPAKPYNSSAAKGKLNSAKLDKNKLTEGSPDKPSPRKVRQTRTTTTKTATTKTTTIKGATAKSSTTRATAIKTAATKTATASSTRRRSVMAKSEFNLVLRTPVVVAPRGRKMTAKAFVSPVKETLEHVTEIVEKKSAEVAAIRTARLSLEQGNSRFGSKSSEAEGNAATPTTTKTKADGKVGSLASAESHSTVTVMPSPKEKKVSKGTAARSTKVAVMEAVIVKEYSSKSHSAVKKQKEKTPSRSKTSGSTPKQTPAEYATSAKRSVSSPIVVPSSKVKSVTKRQKTVATPKQSAAAKKEFNAKLNSLAPAVPSPVKSSVKQAKKQAEKTPSKTRKSVATPKPSVIAKEELKKNIGSPVPVIPSPAKETKKQAGKTPPRSRRSVSIKQTPVLSETADRSRRSAPNPLFINKIVELASTDSVSITSVGNVESKECIQSSSASRKRKSVINIATPVVVKVKKVEKSQKKPVRKVTPTRLSIARNIAKSGKIASPDFGAGDNSLLYVTPEVELVTRRAGHTPYHTPLVANRAINNVPRKAAPKAPTPKLNDTTVSSANSSMVSEDGDASMEVPSAGKSWCSIM